ncbi:CoA-transferase [Amycolatopsis sp. DSM 110486]|uniref:CoA-transferase n=1 Tax=Amycolatopsis sp. DSM 110486 TaxID=2865832 RepID=UPI001C6A2275|nr:CoA-transferase [Amycolatopsis sp. DSM 110486]QYN18105.1 hypothetical protein K1T34_35905 [Amycolatopsis sp. DSM 110486]
MSESKVLPLAEAVEKFVRPGAFLHLAYNGGRPNAAVAEIIRKFAGTEPGFRISAQGFVNTQHALVAAGLVKTLTVAYAGENFPSPRPNPALQRASADGSVEIENWSIWTLTARLMAGALGVPFLPVRSLAGSTMAQEHAGRDYHEVGPDGAVSPVVTALRPDLVLLHGLAADPAGNVILAPPYGEGAWGSLAARDGVIACVEEIVDDSFIRRHNSLPMIPAHAVRAVCHTPFGSHPYGLQPVGLEGVSGYVEDAEFMDELRAAAADPEELARWTKKWITGVRDHDAFLARLGEDRLRTLREGRPVVWPPSLATGPTVEERMTLTAARIVGDRITVAGHDVALAGIGFAHLAAWVAVARLRSAGSPVQLAAELGMSGFEPQPGDPYLFAGRNLPTCLQLTDVMTVLGRDMAGPGTSSIAVLGAGQIDAEGNINSTVGADGGFLVGSGGANDVASAADDVVAVVKHSPRRLVETVPYVTVPGRRVSAIVTSEAVLERRNGRYEITSYVEVPRTDRDATLRKIVERTGFPVTVAADCRPEPLPDAADLERLRGYDPQRVFLGSVPA